MKQHSEPGGEPEATFWVKVAKTLRFHSARMLRMLRGIWWDRYHPKADRPIFVLGCSRAGTTLVYKTFSESGEIGSLQRETHDFWTDLHPLQAKEWNTHGLDESDANASDREYVGRYFYSWTGHHRWVDKNNQNGLCVSYLHALFPDAVFVYVKRSPGDNLNSLIEGWGKPDEFATWSQALPEKVDIDGRYKQWCFFLAEGWRDYLKQPIENVCAFQYRTINESILNAKNLIPGDQWVEVFYEDLLKNPVGEFHRLFESCGLSFDAKMETHSKEVLANPYNAFSEIRADKWKDSDNRARIEQSLDQVRTVAERMGYSL